MVVADMSHVGTSIFDMVTPKDVAAAILRRLGSRVEAKKLQKLVYFAQIASLAWYDTPLFREDVRAYRDGPVVYSLFKEHQGDYWVSSTEGDPSELSPQASCIVEFVCSVFGDESGDDLSYLTHAEGPWPEVRAANGVKDGESCDLPIPQAAMRDYGRAKEEIMDQAWFWTPSWQERDRAVEGQRSQGLGDTFNSDEDLKRALS